MIYRKKISSYLVTTLKPFVLLFDIYQYLFLAFIDLVYINLYYIFLVLTLTTIFLLDLKYYLDLIRYYAKSYILLSIYKHIYTIDDW